MPVVPGQEGTGLGYHLERLEVDVRAARYAVVGPQPGAFFARAVGAEASIGHDRFVAVLPIHSKGVVSDPMSARDSSFFRHVPPTSQEGRGARGPRQGEGLRRSVCYIGAVLGFVLLVSPVEATPVDRAAEFVGQNVLLEGFVERVVCSPGACLLAFDSGFGGLVARIGARDLERFPDPRSSYERRNVAIEGVVTSEDGRLRMDLSGPGRIRVQDAPATSGGSRVVTNRARTPLVSGSARSTGRTVSEEGRGQTRVEVFDGQSGPAGVGLSSRIAELEAEADGSGSASESSVAVEGLRARVAIQNQTIRELREELEDMRARLDAIDAAPAVEGEVASPVEVPEIGSWVVPSRRGWSAPRPRTGWSVERLVRELGSPLSLSEVGPDRALWVYGEGKAVTVVRGRVVSASGF
jgi:hypothetical protein